MRSPLEVIEWVMKVRPFVTQIHQLHAFLIHRGLHFDNLLIARFIDLCSFSSSSSSLNQYALSVLSLAKQPDTFVFNTLIRMVSHSQAMPLYTQILVSGNKPDSYTIPFVLNAVSHLSEARQIHCHSIATGLASGLSVATALIKKYSLFGIVQDARKVFDEMPLRNLMPWNAMLACYAKAGDAQAALEMFDEMPHRNLISWTCIVSGFAQAKRPREAVSAFGRMWLDGFEPDEVATLALLSACAQLGSLELGKRIHGYILKRGFSKKLALNNALVDMYAKSGSINKAVDVFETIEEKRSVVTYTVMISGLALHGLGNEAIEMFYQMESDSVKPNETTLLSVLSACSHAGLVETGCSFFDLVASRYQIHPKIEHYGCMIDMLGRACLLEEAKQLIKAMPFEANAAIWGSLLSASKIHGDLELGKQALRHLMVLEPQNSGNYSLLSNIHASLGGFDESGLLRKVMRDLGVKKTPGESFVEVNNRVHRFVAGDSSSSELVVAFEIVHKIFNQLKMDADLRMEIIEFLEFHE